jgi:hypothetical protein
VEEMPIILFNAEDTVSQHDLSNDIFLSSDKCHSSLFSRRVSDLFKQPARA